MEDITDPPAPPRPQKRPLEEEHASDSTIPGPILPTDSPSTNADNVERNGVNGLIVDVDQGKANGSSEPTAKKQKIEDSEPEKKPTDARDKVKGMALVKEE